MNALGSHILAELNGVSSEHLNDPAFLERALVGAAQDAGATIIESSFNPFAPHGVTGVVVIQESHLAIHTWPEHGYAALDVFTCGSAIDPAQIVQAISESLGADSCETQRIDRGEQTTPTQAASGQQGAMKRSIWFTDRQDDIALSLRHAGVLFSEQSIYQKVEVVQSYGYGKMLLLDGQIAFTERDEFVYHEMIAHVPALHHPSPGRVLIIGGGDGGACREFLKHESINEIAVVEIDPTVTEACRDHFPTIANSLDDPRVQLVHGDGHAFLESSAEPFDLIVVDSLDTSGEIPFGDQFYSGIKATLAPGGLCVMQIPAPTLSPVRFTQAVKSIQDVFTHTSPYLAFLPTYSTGMLSFALASTTPHTLERDTTSLSALHYVNDGVLGAALLLPTFVQNLIEE
jgi:spermidine synthase